MSHFPLCTGRFRAAESDIKWENCYYEDCGDGTLILISPDIPENVLVSRFPAGTAGRAGIAEPGRLAPVIERFLNP